MKSAPSAIWRWFHSKRVVRRDPQTIEDQVTYPLATAMLAVPGVADVRGASMNGDSFVYVIFDDNTDPYWARSRVLEYLNQVQGQLPDVSVKLEEVLRRVPGTASVVAERAMGGHYLDIKVDRDETDT